MPEAAEVTVAARQLAHVSVGRRLTALPVTHARTMRSTTRHALDELVGRHIVGVASHGKWILVSLADSPRMLGVHLRMSGLLLARRPAEEPTDRHVHARLVLGERVGQAVSLDGVPAPPPGAAGTDGDPVTVWFRDPRTFGELRVLDAPPGADDVRSRVVTAHLLRDRARTRSIGVKPLLLDQARFVSGIGSYLADEVLHAAGLDPRAPANTLAVSAWTRILDAARTQIAVSATVGGVTLADEGWMDLWGRPGNHADGMRVHGRDTCGTCGAATSSAVLAGRSARWCRHCQHPRRRR